MLSYKDQSADIRPDNFLPGLRCESHVARGLGLQAVMIGLMV
jgi:hypothetical protein